MCSQGIWTKTIGYDPYAGQAEQEAQAATKQEEDNTFERAKGIMEVAKLQNNDRGDSERSQDFAKHLFWGLKRKAPPIGHEYTAVAEDSSDEDDDDEDDDEEARIMRAAREAARAKLAADDSNGKRGRDESDDDQRRKEKKRHKEKKGQVGIAPIMVQWAAQEVGLINRFGSPMPGTIEGPA